VVSTDQILDPCVRGIARSKRDGTRAETRFGLSAKRTSPFKSAGVSVQSTTGSRGVRISGQQLYRPVMGKLFKEGAKGKEKNFRRANIIY